MLLLERIIGEAKILESDREKLPPGVLCRVKEPVCNVNRLNANKRKYGWDVIERVTGDKTLSEQIAKRALFGHAEHPATSQSNLELVSHVICEWVVDKNSDTVYQVFDVLDTPTGRIVDCLIRANCGVGVSTRAEGELLEEVDPKTKEKFHRVVAEKYKYITTDFTADPSTFGTMPIEVKRNVVESIKQAAICEKAGKGDKQFAGAVLESMLCQHSKDGKNSTCDQCGCCQAIKEASVQIVADPNGRTVNVVGDVDIVNISPNSAVHVSINTEQQTDATPVVKNPDQPDQPDSEDEDLESEDEDLENNEIDWDKVDSEAEAKDEDEIGEKRSKSSGKKVDEGVDVLTTEQAGLSALSADSQFEVDRHLTGGKVKVISKVFGKPTYSVDKTEDSAETRTTWIGEIDGKPFTVSVVDDSGDLETVISADDHETINKVIQYIKLKVQWSMPATKKFPNESKQKTAGNTLKEMNKLRVKNAVLMAERNRLANVIDVTGNTSLQLKIAMKKLSEARVTEGCEVDALRAKLEERAAAVVTVTKKLNAAVTQIKALTEKVDELTVGKEKMLKENKQKIEGVEKDKRKALDEQVNKAKADATRAIVMEYANRKLAGFKSIHDNVRALLESCKTIAEVDEVLDETRESMRKSAIHSNAPKEVTVREVLTENTSVRKQIGNAFTGMQMG